MPVDSRALKTHAVVHNCALGPLQTRGFSWTKRRRFSKCSLNFTWLSQRRCNYCCVKSWLFAVAMSCPRGWESATPPLRTFFNFDQTASLPAAAFQLSSMCDYLQRASFKRASAFEVDGQLVDTSVDCWAVAISLRCASDLQATAQIFLHRYSVFMLDGRKAPALLVRRVTNYFRHSLCVEASRIIQSSKSETRVRSRSRSFHGVGKDSVHAFLRTSWSKDRHFAATSYSDMKRRRRNCDRSRALSWEISHPVSRLVCDRIAASTTFQLTRKKLSRILQSLVALSGIFHSVSMFSPQWSRGKYGGTIRWPVSERKLSKLWHNRLLHRSTRDHVLS